MPLLVLSFERSEAPNPKESGSEGTMQIPDDLLQPFSVA